MVSLIALVIVVAQFGVAPPPSAKAIEIARLLNATGYHFTPTAAEGLYGELEHDGSTVGVSLRDFNRPPFGPTGSITLSIELRFPREVSSGRSPIPDLNDPVPPSETTMFVSYLGRTVMVSKYIKPESASNVETLRPVLDGFWREVDDFARAYNGRFEAVSLDYFRTLKIPDDVVLQRADFVSIKRLIGSWDWTYKGPIGFSGKPRYFAALDIGGTHLWIDQANDSNGHFDESRFVVSAMNGGLVPDTVEFGKGLKAGEIRRRILVFAKRVKKHETP